MAMLSNTDLRNGIVFRDGGEIFSVIKYEHNFRGRGGSVVKVKVRNVRTGNVQELSFRQNERVESVETHRGDVQYLYSDGAAAFFMDAATFDQFSLPIAEIGESVKFLKDGEKTVALYLEGKPVGIEIRKSAELKVVSTAAGVRGNTANNPTKKATLENGLVLDVPLFVKEGDTIKVNTETLSYVSRA